MYHGDRATRRDVLTQLLGEVFDELDDLESRIAALERVRGRESTDSGGVTLTSARLITLAQCSEALGVSRQTVYRLLEAGELTRVRVGSAARVTRVSLDAYLDRIAADSVQDRADQ